MKNGAASAIGLLIAAGVLWLARDVLIPFALAILPSPGFFRSSIFAPMFLRYSGSFAASETACVPATYPTAPITEKPNATTMTVESTRPSFQRSRRRAAGASRKASRIASANGISTSRAR